MDQRLISHKPLIKSNGYWIFSVKSFADQNIFYCMIDKRIYYKSVIPVCTCDYYSLAILLGNRTSLFSEAVTIPWVNAGLVYKCLIPFSEKKTIFTNNN